MISIIIPVFNQAKKLERCLASLTLQSYQDFEIIVVNDGSSDNPEKAIYKYEKSFKNPIKFITQNNQGSNPARNRGAKEAQGEFYLFLDADIRLVPTALETMLKALLDNPNDGFAYGSFKYGAKIFKLFPYDEAKLKQVPYIHTSSLIRKECWSGFDEKIKKFQDWDMWLTMLENGHKGIFIDQIIFYVSTGGSISSWLPSFAYKLMPWLNTVKKYNEAQAIIKTKHHL